ncbi:MAG: hypothetical protein JWP11_818 [Frankiales bacterium]|nr:hypothetical protein [Frankiales bacterium]
MAIWARVLDLQGRSRRNALQAAAGLHRRRAEAAEAQQATQVVAASYSSDAAAEAGDRLLARDTFPER